MTRLFGVPMGTMLVLLLVLLGIALATVGYVFVRNRVLFRMGMRNIPRRRAQTVLIVIGLMLSTLIISAALTMGDTVQYSISGEVYRVLDETDELIAYQQSAGEDDGERESVGTDSRFIPAATLAVIEQAAAGSSAIEGVMPMLSVRATALNPRSGLSEPELRLVALDPARLEPFGPLEDADGRPADLQGLQAGEVLVNEPLAEELAARPGDTLDLVYRNRTYSLTVKGVVEESFFTGSLGSSDVESRRSGAVMPLAAAQQLFGLEGQINYIAVTNRGDERSGLELSEQARADLLPAARANNLAVDEVKENAVRLAETVGQFFATFFMAMGLFAIATGIMLIFLIFVMLAAERRSELGMARAIGTRRRHLIQMFLSEGMGYNLLSAAVGAAIGVAIAFGLVKVMARIFAEQDFSITPHLAPRSLIVAYSMGVVLTFVTVVVSSWRVSRLNIVRAIRDIPNPSFRRARRRSLFLGVGVVVFGLLLALSGASSQQAFPWSLGVSLVPLGFVLVARWMGAARRPLYTAVGLLLLAYWSLLFDPLEQRLVGELEGGIEMFFLSGIMMVAAATMVVMFNADLLLPLLGRLGHGFSRVLPAVRTAIAYPLDNRFRSGLTVAMFALVVFALVMMAIMNHSFSRLVFQSEAARGGWDVAVDVNRNNPIGDFPAALSSTPQVAPSAVEAVGAVAADANDDETARVAGTGPWQDTRVLGVDAAFAANSRLELKTRVAGYATDADVWQALAAGEAVAVVDASVTTPAGPFGPLPDHLHIEGVEPNDTVMDPVTVEVRDPSGGGSRTVTVIGVLSDALQNPRFLGLYLPLPVFKALFPGEPASSFFVRVAPGEDSVALARTVEAAFVKNGVQATSLREELEEQQAQSRSFMYLIEAFMGLGLVVGIAALGVIAFRSVVERRQQIGMLRAIGYQRYHVALSFLFESSFIALTGVLLGVGLGILLSWRLLTSDVFSSADLPFGIPWVELAVFVALAYGAALLMTLIPSRAAASVPIAEALRYE